MKIQDYDLTYNDLNPTFLYVCNLVRTENEVCYHSHEHIEISIIAKGKGTFHVDGKDYPVKAGDLLIFNPGTYHKSVMTNKEELMTEYYIAFTDINFRDCEPNTVPFPDHDFIYSLSGEIKEHVLDLCNSMNKESQSNKPGRYFMLKAYLIEFLVTLLRGQQFIKHAQEGYIFASPNKKYVVDQMIRYFTEHYPEKISLECIAQNMYLSPFYLSKIFKSETGDTPISYLIGLRMEKARNIMKENPALSIQTIAQSVGYEDAYHFSKLFKKHFGIPPSTYKKTV
ncbi:AraC-like DNA-binding protein/uncharacterized cupin superfamily protein [Aequitasia blattaphilus]|uniref:AraC family transcriptional regulator n=1 Tax=Aequitasia blattaphilus TaxID=2949332 RepID=A0ABT1E8U2_9FIRM|nr:AraC family transcriptional regulator [Aequitasia blattaphilus]MCP1102240.1 AraC family transcriptional regulator [Aequitasia blattaphilus]MCR8614880.1 AraC family transcriptional regulator [Aequitasia blattaphilus]